MTVVLDVGAARYGDDYSIERLIERFHPTELYAFDPNQANSILSPPGTTVYVVRAAAWIYEGEIGFKEDGLRSRLDPDSSTKVSCIDLARVIEGIHLERDPGIVLKLDCEGAEYTLLAHLISKRADEKLDLCLVEWHPIEDPAYSRELLESHLRCPLEEWTF